MANDVVLSASMRSNLLSLQNTQRSIDMTQLRLATGKKVNSALDNPQSFFTSQSLSNRASDLTRLLDGIGQSIRTIEEADKGITALTSLVTQADSIVNSARDELAASDGEARAVGNVNLNAVADITTGAFSTAGIGNGDQFRIITTDAAGAQITETITIATGDTAASLTARITDQFADNRHGEIKASVTADGYISIESANGKSFKIADNTTATQLTVAGWTALGLGRYFEVEQRGSAANTLASTTIVAGNTAGSISLYEATGNLVDAGDAIVNANLIDASGTSVLAGIQAGDSFTFNVNNAAATTTSITLGATTSWQDVVDQINQTAAVNTLISAEFDALTGSIKFTSLSDTVENLQVGYNSGAVTSTGRVFDIGLGDPTGNLDPIAAQAVSNTSEYVLSFNTSTEALDQYTKDFNTIRDQIDDIVKDAQYRGVNLLNGDDLVTFFNEDNSSQLTTEGSIFTSDGLGLTVANFRSSEAIETMSGLTKEALTTVRSFGSSLANNLSVIQTRRTFTEETIVTLKAGSADLVNADDNEEGANLLALQTRQQLGVTSLSLASQSQQSVLRLF